MRRLRTLGLWLPLVSFAGCSSSLGEPADFGPGDARSGELGTRDTGFGDIGTADRAADPPDSRPADTAADMLAGCTAKSPDGTPLNPGCDPEIQALGPSAMASITLGDEPLWLITRGKKWWAYGETATPGKYDFTLAGKSFEKLVSALEPASCAALGNDGVPLNPACDATIQTSGPTSMATAALGGKVVWIITAGAKYWLYGETTTPGQYAFTAAGASFASVVASAFQPTSCAALGLDGVPLNPGCDATIQATGPVAMTTPTLAGELAWILTAGKKYWIFGQVTPGVYAFTTSGGDFAASALAAFAPKTCSSIGGDGIPLNPGCDVTIKSDGPTSMTSISFGGHLTWIITAGTKYWRFTETTTPGTFAFTECGADFAAMTLAAYSN